MLKTYIWSSGSLQRCLRTLVLVFLVALPNVSNAQDLHLVLLFPVALSNAQDLHLVLLFSAALSNANTQDLNLVLLFLVALSNVWSFLPL